MKCKKINTELVWKQVEDFLVPRLGLTVIERAAYSHLLRHSRLEGKPSLHFSIPWLARGIRLSSGPAREAVRRLVGCGVLRLVQRSKAGHIVEVRVPGEVRAAFPDTGNGGHGACGSGDRSVNIEELDFFQTASLRKAIHARERGACFYCLRRLNPGVQCLDHVVPQVRTGGNSYRNLVSCCLECNTRKAQTAAAEFLRWLYREGRLTSGELTARLRALDALASGKLRPTLATPVNPKPRKGRPAHTVGAPL